MEKTAKSTLGASGQALLALPGAGWIVLALIVVCIAVFVGLFVVVYTTLQSLHLFDAIIFSVLVLGMMVLCARVGLLTKETMREHSWIWLLLPCAFVFGYVLQMFSTAGAALTVAPMPTLSTSSATYESSVALSTMVTFLFVCLCLGILATLLHGKRRQIEPHRRYTRRY